MRQVHFTYDRTMAWVREVLVDGKPREIEAKPLFECMSLWAKQEPEAIFTWAPEGLDAEPLQQKALTLDGTDALIFSCTKQHESWLQELGLVYFDRPYFNRQDCNLYPSMVMGLGIGMGPSSAFLGFKKSSDNPHADALCLGLSLIDKGWSLLFDAQLSYTDEQLHRGPVRQALALHVVKQKKWIWTLFFCGLKGKISRIKKITACVGAFFKRLPEIQAESPKNTKNIASLPQTYEVIIPSLGRDKFLLKTLDDLAKQTWLPTKVHVIEQKPQGETSSLVDKFQAYPFALEHQCIHTLGACNARNLALAACQSDWVFLADDDIEMEAKLLDQARKFLAQSQAKMLSFRVVHAGEKKPGQAKTIHHRFGSGCTFMQRIPGLRFDMRFEKGYGEDLDFGVQARKLLGSHVLQNDQLQLFHHKAPAGGFRFPKEHPWHAAGDQPKPAPHMMAYYLKNASALQLKGFKTHYLWPKSM